MFNLFFRLCSNASLHVLLERQQCWPYCLTHCVSTVLWLDRPNQLRFVWIQFKSNDHSLLMKHLLIHLPCLCHAMKRCAMIAKRRIMLKLPKIMVTWLEMGKTKLGWFCWSISGLTMSCALLLLSLFSQWSS